MSSCQELEGWRAPMLACSRGKEVRQVESTVSSVTQASKARLVCS